MALAIRAIVGGIIQFCTLIFVPYAQFDPDENIAQFDPDEEFVEFDD